MDGPCCGPRDERRDGASGLLLDAVPEGAGNHPATLVDVAAGPFRMGDESVWAYPGDGEGPVHEVTLAGFGVDRFAVTNDAFARFVDATGWVTTPSATAGRSCSVVCCPRGPPTRGGS